MSENGVGVLQEYDRRREPEVFVDKRGRDGGVGRSPRMELCPGFCEYEHPKVAAVLGQRRGALNAGLDSFQVDPGRGRCDPLTHTLA